MQRARVRAGADQHGPGRDLRTVGAADADDARARRRARPRPPCTTCTPPFPQAARSAASSTRLSTARSSGTDSPPRTSGPSPGSSRRSSRPVRRSTGRPSVRRKAARLSSSARSPERRWRRRPCRRAQAGRLDGGGRELRGEAGHRRTDSTPSSSSSSSPGQASVTGASMPPATHDAPDDGAGSSTVTACRRGRPPGAAQADHAGAEHQHVRHDRTTRSLRRHDPDQVRRSGSRIPSQPPAGSRAPPARVQAPSRGRAPPPRTAPPQRRTEARAALSDARSAENSARGREPGATQAPSRPHDDPGRARRFATRRPPRPAPPAAAQARGTRPARGPAHGRHDRPGATTQADADVPTAPVRAAPHAGRQTPRRPGAALNGNGAARRNRREAENRARGREAGARTVGNRGANPRPALRREARLAWSTVPGLDGDSLRARAGRRAALPVHRRAARPRRPRGVRRRGAGRRRGHRAAA